MSEQSVKLSNDALKAVETIRGTRSENVADTVGRALGVSEFLVRERAKGAKVLIKHADGTIQEVRSP